MAGTEDCPLDDDLIEHIFSFLPTRDVVKTCVLSRRWRSYWTTISDLRFSVSSRHDSFVDRVLSSGRVTRCLHCFMIALGLTRLLFRGCRFPSRESMSWCSLESLSIENVTDDVLQEILMGSPVLQYLTLKRPWGAKHIHSRSLRELVIDAYSTLSPMRVSTPRLLSLRVRVDYFREIIRIVEAPSLLEAELDFNGPAESDFCLLKEMLCKLQNVTRILFGAWCCWVMQPLKVADVQVSLPNCKSLTLHVPIPEFSFPAIANMLATTPNLEKLVIIFKPYGLYSKISDLDSSNVDHESYWHIKKKFKRWAQHLKNVEIVGFYGSLRFKYEEVLTLVKFLLGHAFVLENMVFKVMNGSQDLEVVGSHKLHEVAQQLQCYHRASKHAAVIFNYLEEEHGKRQKKEHILIGYKDAWLKEENCKLQHQLAWCW